MASARKPAPTSESTQGSRRGRSRSARAPTRLGAALPQAEHRLQYKLTFRFRHTGNLQAMFAEARRCSGWRPTTRSNSRNSPTGQLWMIDKEIGKVARANRERTIESVLATFRGRGASGDTTQQPWARSGSHSMRSPSTSATEPIID